MKQLIYFLSLSLVSLIGCKSPIKFLVCVEASHCGGAPPQSIEAVNLSPFEGQVIFVGARDSILVALDESGRATVKLAKGTYNWYRMEKSQDVETIKKTLLNLNRNLYKFIGDTCVKDWKGIADGTFTLKNDSAKFELRLKNRCYTNLYPCLEYIGPDYN